MTAVTLASQEVLGEEVVVQKIIVGGEDTVMNTEETT